MRQDLEDQLGGVSDKVYYQVHDAFSDLANQSGSIARAVDTNVRSQIESQQVIQEVIEKVLIQYKDKIDQLVIEITNSVMTELKKKPN